MERLFCKFCGNPTDADSKYCMQCGLLLNYEPKGSTDYVKEEKKYIFPSRPVNTDRSISSSYHSKYDESYDKELEATSVGVSVIIFGLLLLYTGELTDPKTVPIIHGFNIIWRIIATIWVVFIANRQNRYAVGWGIAAFLAPNLILIIIGLQKKLLK